MARPRVRSYRAPDVWPGYVDALTTLLLTITFLLTVYVLAQFFLSQALSGRQQALERLKQDVTTLSQQLAGARKATEDAEAKVAGLTASVQSANETREAAEKQAAAAGGDVDRLNAQVAELNQQLGQIAALNASEVKARADQVVITDLGQRLQVALAEKVAEMARY